jgi:hypothetical protein
MQRGEGGAVQHVVDEDAHARAPSGQLRGLVLEPRFEKVELMAQPRVFFLERSAIKPVRIEDGDVHAT